jgi:hypothetical protein
LKIQNVVRHAITKEENGAKAGTLTPGLLLKGHKTVRQPPHSLPSVKKAL